MNAVQIKSKVMLTVNWIQFENIKRKYNLPKSDGRLKYFDFNRELNDKISFLINELNIHDLINLEILDISTGFGYMPLICKTIGHRVTVTDAKDLVYDEVRNVFGLSAIPFTYPNDRYIELPTFNQNFDVISALSIVSHSFWSEEEWIKFVNNSLTHLNAGGILYIKPNYSDGLNKLKDMLKNNTIQNITISYPSGNSVKIQKLS